MKNLTIEATIENLPSVLEFIDGILEENGCDMKNQLVIDMAVEELYVNIANYAYEGKTGEASIDCEVDEDNNAVIILSDTGMFYDPLAKPDPDTTLSIEDRQIGGLGIYMVKQSMDRFNYRYEDGKNISTIVKKITDQ